MQALLTTKYAGMNRKKIIGITLAVAIAGGGWYGYKEYTRKVKDLRHVNAQVRMKAPELLAEFGKDETGANALYLDKIIAVNGKVREVEKDDQGHFTVILGEEGSMSSVRCSMDSVHQDEIIDLTAGSIITMKGACTGFNADELLGADVILNRCVLEK
jgi:hypothetical protein